jgi:hypothetical protein
MEHVRARIAIGHGIDVECVDLIHTRLEARRRRLERTPQRSAVELRNDARDCNIAMTSP